MAQRGLEFAPDFWALARDRAYRRGNLRPGPEWARVTGIPYPTMARWIVQKARPTSDVAILKIARHEGITLSELTEVVDISPVLLLALELAEKEGKTLAEALNGHTGDTDTRVHLHVESRLPHLFRPRLRAA